MASLTLVVIALSAVSAQPKLLDFYSEHCGPCRQMAPVIDELERRGHTVEKIDVDRQPQLAAQYRVQSIPCLVVVVDGRETDRSLGVTPIAQLEKMLHAAGTSSAVAAAPAAAAAQATPAAGSPPISPAAPSRGPMRDAMASLVPGRRRPANGPSTRGRQPLGGTGTPRLSPGEQVRPQSEPNDPIQAQAAVQQPNSPEPQLTGIVSEQPLHAAAPDFAGAPLAAGAAANSPDWRGSHADGPNSSTPAAAPAAAPGQNGLPDRLLAASVRLRIQEPGGGSSTGSGTIIDVRGEDALILTCGHVFRDSHGKGKVLVDMFGPNAPQGLEGEVISFDLDDSRGTDVGLISFRPGVPVTAARLAAPGSRIQPGDPVFNTGCNNGDPPTLRSSRVTSIDKYQGAANLQVAGQPVQGRSGGGLFNAHGEVIGVCNAADPQDNEGLYAALPSVYKLLDNAGLAGVYQPGGELAAAGQGAPSNLSPMPPYMPEQMPLASNPPTANETSAPQHPFAGAAPLAGPGATPQDAMPPGSPFPPAAGSPAQLSPAEQQALAAMQQAGHAEVVCIVRPIGNPHAKSDVIMLDRASPEFLQVLASERQRHASAAAMSATTPPNPMARSSAMLEARQINPAAAALR